MSNQPLTVDIPSDNVLFRLHTEELEEGPARPARIVVVPYLDFVVEANHLRDQYTDDDGDLDVYGLMNDLRTLLINRFRAPDCLTIGEANGILLACESADSEFKKKLSASLSSVNITPSHRLASQSQPSTTFSNESQVAEPLEPSNGSETTPQ